jgi:pimeloyl-ACP methyl ester carboxylesterase
MNEKTQKPVPSINYSDTGTGNVIVFLHGFLETSAIWDDFTEQLSGQFRIIAMDLPGFGDSGVLAEEHSMELMATELRNILEIEGVSKCVLVGHSMGGYVAMAFAELYPAFLKGLILFHSHTGADSEEAKANRDRAVKIVEKDKIEFITSFIPELFAPHNRKVYNKEIALLSDLAAQNSKEGIIAAIKGMKNRKDRTALLNKLKCPVLFIAGKYDTRAPLDLVLSQVDSSEKAVVAILEDSGHMGFIEARDETLEIINDFASTVW